MVVRSYDDEMQYVERINDYSWRIKKGFQPNMNVEVCLIRISLIKGGNIVQDYSV